jgi:hypothetical protein
LIFLKYILNKFIKYPIQEKGSVLLILVQNNKGYLTLKGSFLLSKKIQHSVNCENRKAINIIYFVGKLLKALNGINNGEVLVKECLRTILTLTTLCFPILQGSSMVDKVQIQTRIRSERKCSK